MSCIIWYTHLCSPIGIWTCNFEVFLWPAFFKAAQENSFLKQRFPWLSFFFLFFPFFWFVFLFPDSAWDWFIIDFHCYDCCCEAGWKDGTSSWSGCLGVLGVLARLPSWLARSGGHALLLVAAGGWWGFRGWAREATDAWNDLAWWNCRGLGARLMSK